jgi:phospholipase/carboxylesterase
MRSTLGGLSCHVFPESDSGRPEGAVVLCHGFGAGGDDLVPLHGELLRLKPALARQRFIFPEAPLSLGPGSRAWWMIDFASLERLDDFKSQEPEGMAHARSLLRKLIDEVSAQTKLPIGKIALGGFSQGAMLTTDVALRLEEQPRALAIMSGALLNENVWRAKAQARAGLKVMQSHGHEDPILPFQLGDDLREMLKGAGLAVDFVPFHGGHGIPLEALEKLSLLLDDTLPSSRSKIPT